MESEHEGGGAAAKERKSVIGRGIGIWGGGSTVLAIAGDFSKPLGPFVLWFLVLFAFLAAAAFLLRRVPRIKEWADRAFAGALVGLVIFAAVAGYQMFGPKEARDRGAIASVVQPIAELQVAVLPASETKKTLMRFQNALGASDPVERAAEARAELKAAEDPVVRQMMIESALRHSDANVRQVGLVAALVQRRGQTFAIIPEGDASNPLYNRLVGARFTLARIDPDTGAAYGNLVLSDMNVAASTSIGGGRMILDSRANVRLDLAPDKDLQLSGQAVAPGQQPVKIKTPLL